MNAPGKRPSSTASRSPSPRWPPWPRVRRSGGATRAVPWRSCWSGG